MAKKPTKAKPKSPMELLQEAIASGDMARIKEAGDLLAAEQGASGGPIVVPKAPSRAKPRSKPMPEPDDDVPMSIPIAEVLGTGAEGYDPRNADWIAPSKKPGGGGKTKVAEDGTVLREARRVSMQGAGLKNQFKDDGKGGYDGRSALGKVDAANGRKAASLDRRPPTSKHRVKCLDCHRAHEVYPSEMAEVRDEDGRGSLVYQCSRCIAGRGRGSDGV